MAVKTQTKFGLSLLTALILASFVSTSISAAELSGNVTLEGRYFPSDGAHPGQQTDGGVSASIQPEFKRKWDGDNKQFTFNSFYRVDQQDKERTHADIRQLDFVSSEGDWEYQIGADKVFWGVTESQHLVDIINQTDAVEALGSEKLGQPLIRATRLTENGSIDAYVLPYFRERNHVGIKGRFRAPLVVDDDATTYESSNEERHVDYALRWSTTVDEFDVGLSVFTGTSRDPILKPILGGKLAPHYPLITQFGLDLQYTGEADIWKLEAISRNFKDSAHKDYTAFVSGVEHSLIIDELEGELSLLLEYHHDSRGNVPTAPFQNDVFVGARYSLNDENSSEVLAGAFFDLDNGSKSYSIQASRRIGSGLKLKLEARVFNSDSALAKDDYVQVEVQKFF